MIRHATQADLPSLLALYDHARQFMAQNGNPTQWGTTNPTLETVQNDITQQQSYVILRDGVICGVFVFIIGSDPTYQVIDDGEWLNDKPYGVLHRIASNGTASGILSEALTFCASQIDNLRIDTHHNNHIMQRALERHGFTRCGVIYVRDGSPRLAYQRVVGGFAPKPPAGLCPAPLLGLPPQTPPSFSRKKKKQKEL